MTGNLVVKLLLIVMIAMVIFYLVNTGWGLFKDSRRTKAQLAFRKMEADYARRKVIVDRIISTAMDEMNEATWRRSDRPDDFGLKSDW